MLRRASHAGALLAVVTALALGYSLGSGEGAPQVPVLDFEGAAEPTASGKAAHVRRGPRGPRGPRGRQGPRGPRGPAGPSGGDALTDISINWRGGAWSGRSRGQATLTGIGTLAAVCEPIDGNENGDARLVLTPSGSGVRTVVNVTTFQGAGTEGAASTERKVSEGGAIEIPLPVNGMQTAVFSKEPISGDGGAGPTPWSITAGSEMKLNGPGGADSGENFCFVTLQAAKGD